MIYNDNTDYRSIPIHSTMLSIAISSQIPQLRLKPKPKAELEI